MKGLFRNKRVTNRTMSAKPTRIVTRSQSKANALALEKAHINLANHRKEYDSILRDIQRNIGKQINNFIEEHNCAGDVDILEETVYGNAHSDLDLDTITNMFIFIDKSFDLLTSGGAIWDNFIKTLDNKPLEIKMHILESKRYKNSPKREACFRILDSVRSRANNYLRQNFLI